MLLATIVVALFAHSAHSGHHSTHSSVYTGGGAITETSSMGTRVELLKTYSWYGPEHTLAVKNANSQYVNELELARASTNYSEYHDKLVIAKDSFNKLTNEIIKNCTDLNNTLCQNDLDPMEEYPEFNIFSAIFMGLVVLLPLIVCAFTAFYKQIEKISTNVQQQFCRKRETDHFAYLL